MEWAKVIVFYMRPMQATNEEPNNGVGQTWVLASGHQELIRVNIHNYIIF